MGAAPDLFRGKLLHRANRSVMWFDEKTIGIAAMLFLSGGMLAAQTYFEEDFEQVRFDGKAGDIPDSWVLYNDGNRVDQTFYYCDDAWNVVSDNGNQVAVSPSWFTHANAYADRWMVSPEVALPDEAEAVLTFSARSFDKGEKESYYVLLSLQGVDKDDFIDTLLYVDGEDGNWTRRVIDLSAYSGKKIRLAFVQRSLNRYALYVDDIKVADLQRPQILLRNLLYPDMVEPGAPFSISVLAEAVMTEEMHSCVLSYTMDTGIAMVAEVVPYAKGYGEAAWRSMTVTTDTLRMEKIGTMPFRVWVSSVNGREDIFSDTLSGYVEVSSQDYYPRRTLLEVFSSSTCGPCAQANPYLREAYEAVFAGASAAKLSVLKYQMDIPASGDPCVITEGLYRKELYSISGIPAVFLNGERCSSASGWTDFSSVLSSRVESEWNRLSPFEIEAEGIREGNFFQVDVSLTNAVACDPVKLYVVLAEDSIWHEAQSNGETEFFHVARKVLPSAYGEELALTSSGTRQFSYSVDLGSGNPRIFGPWEGLSAVIFVQDANTLEILQSRTIRFEQESSNEGGSESVFNFRIAPNPCRDVCRVEFSMAEAACVSMAIVDLQGRICYHESGRYGAGTHVLELPAENLRQGVYLLRFSMNGRSYMKKVIIC